MDSKFRVSEVFSSLQGEGPTIGIPSIFIRLGGCNLTCRYCDSPYTWVFSEEKAQAHVDGQQFDSLTELTAMDSMEIIAKVNDLNFGNGIKNVVITGGEPLIYNSIMVKLIVSLHKQGYRIEIETNGTIIPKNSWVDMVSQWNVSPKLENSGVSKSLREIPDVYWWFVTQDRKDFNVFFKFVISAVDDVQEVLALKQEYGISSESIWLMPEGRNEEEIKCKSNGIIEMCKRYGFRYCPRLQIMLWGNRRGV